MESILSENPIKKRKSEAQGDIELYRFNETLLREVESLKKQLAHQKIEHGEIQKLKNEIETLKIEKHAIEQNNHRLIREKVDESHENERFRILFPNMKIMDIKQKMDHLEKENEHLKIRIEASTPTKYSQNPTIHILQEEITTKDQVIEKLKEENLKLRSEIDLKFGRGDFNSATTKVLHLSKTPLSYTSGGVTKEEKQEIIALKQEIEELKKDDAQLKIIDLELSITRLKQQFKVKIQDFRMAVYLLFGFRMDAMEGKMYRLSSMFAESENDFILVQHQDKKISLLESEYCSSLEKNLTDFLTKLDSFPAFMASLSLHLFNKSTRMIQVGSM